MMFAIFGNGHTAEELLEIRRYQRFNHAAMYGVFIFAIVVIMAFSCANTCRDIKCRRNDIAASTSFTSSSMLTTKELETTGEFSSSSTTRTSSTTTTPMNTTTPPPTKTTMKPTTPETSVSTTVSSELTTIASTAAATTETPVLPTKETTTTTIVTNITPEITSVFTTISSESTTVSTRTSTTPMKTTTPSPTETTMKTTTPETTSVSTTISSESTTVPTNTAATTPSTTTFPSTTSSSSVSTISTSTSTGNDFSTYDIYCDDSTNTPLQKASIVGIRITKLKHKLEIFLSNAQNYVLLSKIEKEKNNINCFSKISINDTLTTTIDTSADTVYIFCIKHKNLSSFSLEDCYTIKTLPDIENQMWLQNRDKTTVYLIVGFIVTGVFLLTSVSLYVLLRKYPKLLRNENITIIDPTRAMKNPACFLTSSRTETPQISFNETGCEDGNLNSTYMSPILVRKPARKKVTYSESTNTRSTATSYVTVIEPTNNQLYNWRNDRRHEGDESMELYVSSYSLRPPPLPTRRKIYR